MCYKALTVHTFLTVDAVLNTGFNSRSDHSQPKVGSQLADYPTKNNRYTTRTISTISTLLNVYYISTFNICTYAQNFILALSLIVLLGVIILNLENFARVNLSDKIFRSDFLWRQYFHILYRN